MTTSQSTLNMEAKPCLKKLRRSYPYIMLLQNGTKQNKDKMTLLKSLPDFVIFDLVEVLYNILQGNCHISNKQVKRLQKYKKNLSGFYKSIQKAKTKTLKKKMLYKQGGGFIGAILPVIASIVGGLASSAL